MKTFFTTEWDKLCKMTFPEKLRYIWDYYKFHTLFICLALYLMGLFINIHIINAPKRDYLHIAWAGNTVSNVSLARLGYNLSAIVDNPSREQVTVMSYFRRGDMVVVMAYQQQFDRLLRRGRIHGLITNRRYLYTNKDTISPIYRVMAELYIINPTLYHQLAERLVALTFTDSNGYEVTEYMAVSLANVPLFAQVGIMTDDLYFALAINSRRPYELAKALDFMFSW